VGIAAALSKARSEAMQWKQMEFLSRFIAPDSGRRRERDRRWEFIGCLSVGLSVCLCRLQSTARSLEFARRWVLRLFEGADFGFNV